MKKNKKRTALSQFVYILHHYSQIEGKSISINMPNFHFEQTLKECKEQEKLQIIGGFISGEQNIVDELDLHGEFQDKDFIISHEYFYDNYINQGEKEEAYKEIKELEDYEAKQKKDYHIVETNEMVISDEEIHNAISFDSKEPYVDGFINGAKWYREKLKQKNESNSKFKH